MEGEGVRQDHAMGLTGHDRIEAEIKRNLGGLKHEL